MSEYSLEELKKLARPALQHAELVELVSKQSPKQSPKRVYELAISRWPRRQAKAARFLAILRRDFGQGAIQALISSIEYARPKGTEHAQEGDKMTAVTAPAEPQFLYPFSRQFPFDEVCERIVRELEIRNWQVPGITVKFEHYGTGDQKFRHVSRVMGKDFKLWFCRKQRTMPGGQYNDIAAINEIVIPRKELHVYNSEDGPTYITYVGNNWERDRNQFINGLKVNSKLNDQPRTYLRYKGQCHCISSVRGLFNNLPHTHPGRRSPLLVHDNDLGREYEPQPGKWNWRKKMRQPGDPVSFSTEKVFLEFKEYLEKVLLAQIIAHPISTEKVDVFGITAVPFPQSGIQGEIFCFADSKAAERIKEGKRDPKELQPSDRYGLKGGGYRLVPYGVRNDGTIPDIAYEGFLWCGIAPTLVDVPIEDLEVPGHYRWPDCEQYVIRLRPNRANDIYIADHAPYEKRRKELSDAITDGRKEFTDPEVDDFKRARGRTIIPITEYKGGFEQPVILIDRELGFDEVEIIGDRHSGRRF
jgi:hypothetical protein